MAKRDETVNAVTDCTFGTPRPDDLQVAMPAQPGIRKALEEQRQKRNEIHFADSKPAASQAR